jgi:hypothetical protein
MSTENKENPETFTKARVEPESSWILKKKNPGPSN